MGLINVKMANITKDVGDVNVEQSLYKLMEMNFATDNVLVIDVDGCEDVPYTFIHNTFGRMATRYGKEFKKSIKLQSKDKYTLNKFNSVM